MFDLEGGLHAPFFPRLTEMTSLKVYQIIIKILNVGITLFNHE